MRFLHLIYIYIRLPTNTTKEHFYIKNIKSVGKIIITDSFVFFACHALKVEERAQDFTTYGSFLDSDNFSNFIA